jgi:hypothetical protein
MKFVNSFVGKGFTLKFIFVIGFFIKFKNEKN